LENCVETPLAGGDLPEEPNFLDSNRIDPMISSYHKMLRRQFRIDTMRWSDSAANPIQSNPIQCRDPEMPTESTLNGFARQYLSMLTNDLTEEQLDLVPIDGFHSARWLLCHVATTGDFGLRLLGLPTKSPRTWQVAYAPGSSGVTHPEIRPSKDELLRKIAEIYEQLVEGLGAASQDLLAEPHGLALLQRTAIQTKGQLISHLMTTHFAVHLGQLSAMRRQMGLPHLF